MKQKAQVIPFPKRKSARVLVSQQSEAKQILGALSLVSLVLVAIFANDQIVKAGRPVYIISDNSAPGSVQYQSRGIASAQPIDPLRDLEWEHRLADKLGHKPDGKVDNKVNKEAHFGRQASNLDLIRFGLLAGKYQVTSGDFEKISKIEYVETSNSEDTPQYLDRENFLRSYKSAMTIEFSSFEFLGVHGLTERFQLRDAKNQAVGLAEFQLDEKGRMRSLSFTKTASLSPTDSH